MSDTRQQPQPVTSTITITRDDGNVSLQIGSVAPALMSPAKARKLAAALLKWADKAERT